MISFYLEKMVGKESKKLIVNNPEIYNFSPLEILHKLSCIFSWFLLCGSGLPLGGQDIPISDEGPVGNS